MTRQRGNELELLLPTTRLNAIAMVLAMLACAAAAVAMFLAEQTPFAVALVGMTLMFGAMGRPTHSRAAGSG